MSVTSGVRLNLYSVFRCDFCSPHRSCVQLWYASVLVLLGAMSEVSVAGSMIERLRNFVPDTDGVLAPDQVPGAFVVTDLMVLRCEELADMQGGSAAVIMAEVKGQVYGDCRMDEDVVLLLCQSAQGTYVLRAVRLSAWLEVVKTLTQSPGEVKDAEARAARVASRVSMAGHAPPSPSTRPLQGMEGAMAAYTARQMAVMQSNGTLHGPASQGGFEVPKALFRTTGFLTDAGGNSVSEYRRLVLDESKAEKAAVRAESQQSDLSRSVSRAASDLESVQSGLSARQARLETTHSLRGADGGPVHFSSGIVAEALRQAAAAQAERGMAALALGEAGDGQAPGPVQVTEHVRAMAPNAFLFLECATTTCSCKSSFNGASRTPCCRSCSTARPCSGQTGGPNPAHNTPLIFPTGWVPRPAQTKANIVTALRAFATTRCRTARWARPRGWICSTS